VSLNIWILSDGKAGHLSQTRGLAAALANRLKGHVFELDLSGKGFRAKWSAVWRAYFRLRDADSGHAETPTFIIAAGHGMHAPLLLSGVLLRKAKTVLCMKPSFPMSWFDFCVVPRHDLTPALLANSPAHIIPTLGALHGVHPSPESPKTHTLILIGGPSKEYGWNEKQVVKQLKAVSSRQSEAKFLLTTSRRTPAGFIDALKIACPAIDVVPVEETPRGWVAEKLAGATAVWVTRDSVSMIYESLGSGAPVGLLNMPLRSLDGKKKSRVARGIEMLEQEGWVTPFDLWEQSGILKSKGALVEVDRVAELIASTQCSQ
jgi:mitochondrial fission protein ELM1